MGYLPLFLNVEGVPCLVVGGGRTALRKAAMLLEAGARVDMVSPQFDAAFAELKSRFEETLVLRQEPYASSDLSMYPLVFAATSQHTVNHTVAEDARRGGIWVNVVDKPELCSAICGAELRRGPLQIAVSTGGACPTLAVALRDELAAQYPEWTGVFASALGSLRCWLRERCPETALRRQVLHRLASRDTRDRFRGLESEPLLSQLRDEAEALLRGSGRAKHHG